MNNTYYITTPIYYPSGKLHIGHSYTTVAADAMARYKRMRGFDVMFLTGTDEHGQKIERRAAEAGVAPQTFVDDIVKDILDLWKLLNISNDKFIRTTDDHHKKAVQQIFKTLYDKGDIYKSEYEGWYCSPCESFWTDLQLKDHNCPDCGRPVEMTKEESYFFRISKYQDRLIELFEGDNDFILPQSRRNEMLNNFLRPGLSDLCVSRTTFSWGIPVSFDPSHVVYVWIDALSNYITALGYPEQCDGDYKKFWPADVHLVGKEIVRFHTLIWPALLMALDIPLPKQVFAHGWLLFDGDKMSKSKGNVVDPVVLVDRYGVDAIRYFLLREMPFGADGIFTNEALINRINSDLANDLGNLVSRTVAMIEKYFGGTLPSERQSGEFDDVLAQLARDTVANVEHSLEKLQFSVALADIWKLVSRTNKYIDETMPWVLAKSDSDRPRLASVMYNLAESLRIVSVLLAPFMPDTAAQIQAQIGAKDCTTWQSIAQGWGGMPANLCVTKASSMFPRIDLAEEMTKLSNDSNSLDSPQQAEGTSKNGDATHAKSNSKSANNACAQPNLKKVDVPTASGANDRAAQPSGSPEFISIDDFAKVDLRVGTVLECEQIDGSDKLLKFQIQDGSEVRQIVSGIAKFYDPQSLVGVRVMYVANLKPVKLRGVMSNGMILSAEDEAGLSLLTTERKVADGSTVK